MRKFLRRPSPAMVVAATALVSSFAGPAVADEVARMATHISGAHIKNNTVTSADIRNGSVSQPDIRDGGIFTQDIGTGQVQTPDLGDNAVRGDKIQPNTIDGSDVMDNTLGGREINEGSLGKVASAAAADTAENASRLGGVAAEAFERARPDDYVARFLSDGQELTLAEGGGLRIYATCDVNPSGTTDDVTIWIDSTTDNAAYDDNNGPENSDFDAAAGPDSLFSTGDDDAQEIEVTQSGAGVTGVAADGSVVAFNDYALGVNLGGRPDTCFVSGTVVDGSAS